MRYLAGLAGGTIVAIILFAFQQHLIAAEREVVPIDTIKPTLPTMPESLPPEVKPYTPQELPPKPERPRKPAGPDNSGNETDPHPVLLDLPVIGIDGDGGHGTVPEIHYGGGGMNTGIGVKFPVQPNYPQAALRNGVEGEVELAFTVLPDGSVADVQVIRAEPRGVFEQEAVRAILRWQFYPQREDGEPVAARARQVIRFELPGNR